MDWDGMGGIISFRRTSEHLSTDTPGFWSLLYHVWIGRSRHMCLFAFAFAFAFFISSDSE